MEKLKVIELFGGIMACSTALNNLKVPIELLDYVEIDKFAVASANSIHNTNFKPQDIKTWDKSFKHVDLITHGSSCTDFSLAGKQLGGDKGSGTNSSLMWETVRIMEKLKPKFVLWENVKNVLSKKHIHNFNDYLKELNDLGYVNYYKVLNSKDYNIPQNRERIFVLSIRKDIDRGFEFPVPKELQLKLKDILEFNVENKFYLSNQKTKSLINELSPEVHDCIDTKMQKNSKAKISKTILASCYKEPLNIVESDFRIRRFTPLECWRLMGFKDEEFYKVKSSGISNTQLYKMAGNSIVVNVLEAIFEQMINYGYLENQ